MHDSGQRMLVGVVRVIDAAWIRVDDVPHLPIHPAMRLHIEHAITDPDHAQLR